MQVHLWSKKLPVHLCPLDYKLLSTQFWSLLLKTNTLYNAILRIARNFLETRENIKISTHPFYHVNLDWFSWECTEVRFGSLLSGGFTTMAVINPPEKKLANRTSMQWVLKEFLCNSQLMWLGLLNAWCFALFCSNQKWRLSFLKQPEQHPIEWQARIWFYSSPSDLDEMLPYESQISCSHTIYCLTGDRRRPHLAIGNSQSTVLWRNFCLKCRFWQVT